MVRYFYAWTPLVIVGTVVFLSLPWVAIGRRWQGRSGASQLGAAALRVYGHPYAHGASSQPTLREGHLS